MTDRSKRNPDFQIVSFCFQLGDKAVDQLLQEFPWGGYLCQHMDGRFLLYPERYLGIQKDIKNIQWQGHYLLIPMDGISTPIHLLPTGLTDLVLLISCLSVTGIPMDGRRFLFEISAIGS